MTCRDAAPLIAAAADDRLDRARRALLDEHLAGCASCRDALADQRFVASALSALPQVEASPAFARRVRARIERAGGWFDLVDFRVWTLRLVPAAAVLALLAVVWPGQDTVGTASSRQSQAADTNTSRSFHPANAGDWQQDVSANALLEAALERPAGRNSDVR
jgi:predicted anti-sigma-YlaC factor YlaD